MYSETIKLCQDNKINARNTWTLNLIDYMPMLFKAGSSDRNDTSRQSSAVAENSSEGTSNASGDTNFQLAGVTLDAGVRIYCSRVDSVHTNAFKVLGGLSRTGGRTGGDEADAGEGIEGGEEDGTGRTKRRARRTGRVTLENKMGNITSQKLETDLAVDPLFQKMSAAFDEGGAKGMLLNNLPVGPRGQVIFDSGELAENLVARAEEVQIDPSDTVYDVSEVLPASPPTEAEGICSTFLEFYHARKGRLADSIDGCASEGPRGSSEGLVDGTGGCEALTEPEVDFDYGNEDLQNAEAIGVFAGNEATLDSSLNADEFDDDDEVNMFPCTEECPGRQSLESNGSLAFAARRGSLDLFEAGVALSESSEYSFFDTSAISGWAGPQHWRFRALEATSTAHDDIALNRNNSKKPKRPRGKTAMLLDFSSEAPKINFAKEFAQGKNVDSYHLSKTVREAFSEKKITLPEDLHFSVRSLAALFLKPRTYVRPKRSTRGAPSPAPIDGDAEGWYDFDNECDNENFCPQDDSNLTGSSPDNTGFECDAPSAAIDLIPEPTRVEKIDINYAKVAKKVDVRQLKCGIWSRLCGERSPSIDPEDDAEKRSSQADDAERNERNGSQAGPDATDIRDGKSQTLQDVVRKLPTFVPPTSLSDVSLPYIFICLLHLANEKTLAISQPNDGSLGDLVIESGSDPVG